MRALNGVERVRLLGACSAGRSTISLAERPATNPATGVTLPDRR
jgi:hypothetical protein